MKNDNRVYVQEEQVGVRFFCPRCFYAVAEIPETRRVSRHCANCGHPLEWPTFDDEGAMVQSPKEWNSGGLTAKGSGFSRRENVWTFWRSSCGGTFWNFATLRIP